MERGEGVRWGLGDLRSRDPEAFLGLGATTPAVLPPRIPISPGPWLVCMDREDMGDEAEEGEGKVGVGAVFDRLIELTSSIGLLARSWWIGVVVER